MADEKEQNPAYTSRSDISMLSDTRSVENMKRTPSPTLSSRTYTIDSGSRTDLQNLLDDPDLDRESVPLPMCRTPSNDNLLTKNNQTALDDALDLKGESSRPVTVHDCPLRLPVIPTNSNLTTRNNVDTLSNQSGSRMDLDTISIWQSNRKKRSDILDNLRQCEIIERSVGKSGISFTIELEESRSSLGKKPLPPLGEQKTKVDEKESDSGLKVRESASFDTLQKTNIYADHTESRAREISEQANLAAQKRERILGRLMANRSIYAKRLPPAVVKANEKVGKSLKLEEKKRRKAKTLNDDGKENDPSSLKRTRAKLTSAKHGALGSVKSGRITSSKHKSK